MLEIRGILVQNLGFMHRKFTLLWLLCTCADEYSEDLLSLSGIPLTDDGEPAIEPISDISIDRVNEMAIKPISDISVDRVNEMLNGLKS